jgi:hypothetical protein
MTYTPVIPTDLPETTTDRLLAVADLIEFQPDHYDQEVWWADTGATNPEPYRVANRSRIDCGTTACLAGWGVALSNWSELRSAAAGVVHDDAWTRAGAAAFGLSARFAERLFSSHTHESLGDVSDVADVLRRLAKLPEDRRDTHGAMTVLTEAQVRALRLTLLSDM